jgi:hypothetical protein
MIELFLSAIFTMNSIYIHFIHFSVFAFNAVIASPLFAQVQLTAVVLAAFLVGCSGRTYEYRAVYECDYQKCFIFYAFISTSTPAGNSSFINASMVLDVEE